jgi:hypothetical protein
MSFITTKQLVAAIREAEARLAVEEGRGLLDYWKDLAGLDHKHDTPKDLELHAILEEVLSKPYKEFKQ